VYDTVIEELVVDAGALADEPGGVVSALNTGSVTTCLASDWSVTRQPPSPAVTNDGHAPS
jgi:hypothetical protein